MHPFSDKAYILMHALSGVEALVFLRRKGDCLETQLQTTPHFPVDRSLALWTGNILRANANVSWPQHSGRVDSRHWRSEPVRKQCAGKAGSGSFVAFLAGRHRPWIETKFRSAAFECRHSLGTGAALGGVKRSAATRGGDALRRGL